MELFGRLSLGIDFKRKNFIEYRDNLNMSSKKKHENFAQRVESLSTAWASLPLWNVLAEAGKSSVQLYLIIPQVKYYLEVYYWT